MDDCPHKGGDSSSSSADASSNYGTASV
jgi:hypothetical protein